MKPQLLCVDLTDPDADALKAIATHLRAGQVVLYPTDTIYGLGCDGLNPAAIARLNAIKARDPQKPLLLLIPDDHWVPRLARQVTTELACVVQKFWPGPLTIILPASPEVPRQLCGTSDSIGLRWAHSRFLEALLAHFGGPIVSTSANLAGEAPLCQPTAGGNAILTRVDLVVDAGRLEGRESTLLDLSGPYPRILREGAIGRAELESVLPSLGRL